MYSLMSMRTIACSSSNRNSASARASSVLPTPVGPRNMNDPIGRLGSDKPGAAAADRVGDRGDRVVLADDALVEVVLEVDQLGRLALHQPAHRDAGPLRHDLGDVLGVDLLLEHPVVGLQLVEVRRRLLDAALELGDPAVADLGRDVEVGLALELRAQTPRAPP